MRCWVLQQQLVSFKPFNGFSQNRTSSQWRKKSQGRQSFDERCSRNQLQSGSIQERQSGLNSRSHQQTKTELSLQPKENCGDRAGLFLQRWNIQVTWEAGLVPKLPGCAHQDKSVVNSRPKSPFCFSQLIFLKVHFHKVSNVFFL